jgi:DNA-binding response OmpR family regulator
MARILLIEDEAYVMRGFINSIQGAGYDLDVATTGSEGLTKLRMHYQNYDLVILDLMLPRGNEGNPEDKIPHMDPQKVGEYIYERMDYICPNLPVILLTGIRSNMEGLKPRDKAELMTKPVIFAELLAVIDRMISE